MRQKLERLRNSVHSYRMLHPSGEEDDQPPALAEQPAPAEEATEVRPLYA